MFGYIKPYTPELKIKDFETYKGVYCGLCKQLGKFYGSCSNVALSYDFTFLSLMSLAISDECSGFSKKRCHINPLKKKNCCNFSFSTDFSAACAMMMLYFKILDNIHDSGFFKRIICYFILPFTKRYMKKAKKNYPEIFDIVKKTLENQYKIEKLDDCSFDMAADSTANVLAEIFKALTKDEKQQSVLYHFGYHLGRFVYFCDALNDLKDDLKENNFNPFVKHFNIHELNDKKEEEIYDFAVGLINMTLCEIANSYCLINIKRFEPILSNIIYLGLPEILNSLKNKKEITNERPI